MANEIPELKPCPFCSGNAEIQEGIIYGHYVECNSCELTLGVGYGSDGEWNGYFDGVGDAFRAWNTRTAPKVKPLVWLGGGNRYHTDGGEFAIEKLDSPRRVVWRLLQASLGTSYVADFGGMDALDKAKDLAQEIKARSTIDALE